jgi:hypothetical protein
MPCPRCGGLVLPDYDGDALCLTCGEAVYAPVPEARAPMEDGRRQGGVSRGGFHGHHGSLPLLTVAEVAAIQQATGRAVDLATQYGVSLSTIRNVQAGRYGPGRQERAG